ncbi:hypothetical protein HDU97_007991 [Phlyctochytrium planicorne]|nr:hypothetical protein HDU97_007991 [Phlyctochytrium planicorne]
MRSTSAVLSLCIACISLQSFICHDAWASALPPKPLPLPLSVAEVRRVAPHRLEKRYGYTPLAPPVNCPTTYFVLEGQTCFGIAQSLGMSLYTLQSYNPDVDCNLIYPSM